MGNPSETSDRSNSTDACRSQAKVTFVHENPWQSFVFNLKETPPLIWAWWAAQWRSRETDCSSVFYNALIEYTCCSLVRDLRPVCWSRIETLRGVTRTFYFSRDSCTIRKRQNKAGISELRPTFSYSLKILVATRRAVRGADQNKTSRLKNDHAKPEMVLAISQNQWKHANLQ
jgi:hypothetical protein